MYFQYQQSPTPPSQFTARSGNVYSITPAGIINVPVGLAQDMLDAQANGFDPVVVNPMVYTANAATTAATATAASVASANENILNMTGTLGAGAALTTPTATQILAARATQGYVGETFKTRVINSGGGAFSWTVTAGTGVTVTGTATVAQNTWREFMCTITAIAAGSQAVTLQSIGTGTNS